MPTITFVFTAAQGARIAHAVGVDRELGKDAGIPEVKDYIITALRNVVLRVERMEENRRFVAADLGDVG